MLTGSAITRALVIVVLAAGLAALWQLLTPRATGPHVSEPPKRAEAGRSGKAETAPAGESEDPVRSVYPGPRPAEPPRRQPQAAETVPAPSFSPVPVPTPVPSTPPAQGAAPAPSPPPVFTPPAAPLPPADAAEPGAETPPAAGSVDLNTASLAELNGLRGGGMIGRAIIARRPYASPGDLLSKRVLSRSTYDKIKDQITVR